MMSAERMKEFPKFAAMRPSCRICKKAAEDGGGYWITKGWYLTRTFDRGLMVSYPGGTTEVTCSKDCARTAFEQMLATAEEGF